MSIEEILDDESFLRWLSVHYSHCTLSDILDCGSDALLSVYNDFSLENGGADS